MIDNDLVEGPLRREGSGELHDNESLTMDEDGLEAIYRVKTHDDLITIGLQWSSPDRVPDREELIDICRRRVILPVPSTTKRINLPFSLGTLYAHIMNDETMNEFVAYLWRVKLLVPLTGSIVNRVKRIRLSWEKKEDISLKSRGRDHYIVAGFGGKTVRMISWMNGY